jgi:predicted RNA-binding protein with PUA-like domain
VTVAAWLLKTEPSQYSFTDLQREDRTIWDGVSNALALKNMARIRPGDSLFIYHTGSERAVVGTALAAGAPFRDAEAEDPRRLVLEVSSGEPLPQPVPLAAIKEDPVLSQCELVRLPRLSVVPLDEIQRRRLLELGGLGAA